MTAFILFFTSLILSGAAVEPETIYFDIYFSNSHIGHIKATKKPVKDMILYEVTSEAEYNSWLYDYQRSTHVKAYFRNGKLVSSWAKATEDGDVEILAKASSKNGLYELVDKDDQKREHYGEIPFSSIVLYFNEPKGLNQIFSESYLEMCRIEDLGNNTYEYHTPEGKTNDYIYKNGKLDEVKVYRSVITIRFERRKK